MPSRAIVGVVLVVIATLLVAAPAGAEDLSAAQLCELLPQDQGFSIAPIPAESGCEGRRGDCDRSDGFFETCSSAAIFQRANAAEARGLVNPDGRPIWETLSEVGEVAVGACAVFWCEVRFQRGQFFVSTTSPLDGGLGPALELAKRVDQAIQALGISAPEPQDDTASEPPPVEPGVAAPELDYGDVFYGTANLSALFPDIRTFIDCGAQTPPEDDLACSGASDSVSALARLAATFTSTLPNPTQRQIDGARVYSVAVQLSGLRAWDGTELFPSVGTALPVIKKFSDPETANRFVEMLAAMDAANWEDRLR